MTETHTPAPWSVFPAGDRHGISGQNETTVIVFGVGEDDGGVHGRTGAEAEANARLISAAPELLVSVRELIKQVKRLHGMKFTNRDADIFMRAYAAIAKASNT